MQEKVTNSLYLGFAIKYTSALFCLLVLAVVLLYLFVVCLLFLFIVFVCFIFCCSPPTQKQLVPNISDCFRALSLIVTRIPTSRLVPSSLLAVVFSSVPVGGNGIRGTPEEDGGLAVRVACVDGVKGLVECVVRWWREVVSGCEWWECFVGDVLGSLETVGACPVELCELGGRERGREGGREMG